MLHRSVAKAVSKRPVSATVKLSFLLVLKGIEAGCTETADAEAEPAAEDLAEDLKEESKEGAEVDCCT